MVAPIKVKNKQGEQLEASIFMGDLFITGLPGIHLGLIYNVQNEPKNIFRVDYTWQIDQEWQEEDSKQPKTLLNIRPKNLAWTRQTLEFQTDDDISDFVTHLISLTVPLKNQFPNTRIYCILNPSSGDGFAECHWERIVTPMLTTAGFQQKNLTKYTTKSNGKTRNIAKSLGEKILKDQHDHAPIIICMGGDSTLYEVVNGLSDALNEGIGHFRLGVLPAGSGNAFALGLDIESLEHGTLKIIQAREEKPFYSMDIKFGHNGIKDWHKQFFHHNDTEDWYKNVEYDAYVEPTQSTAVFSWGFHTQIVSKSRFLRYFMGNIRFSLVAKFLLTFLQQYDGDLVLKNVKKYNPETKVFEEKQDTVILGQEKKFTYFIVSKQHSLEKGFKIAPFASVLSEDMDVVVLRDATSESLASASINAFDDGAHVESNDVEYFKTNELYLRVKDKTKVCLDGEIHDLPANGIVHLKTVISGSKKVSFTIFT